MPTFPEKQLQIIQTHGELIRRVVLACGNPGHISELEPVLKQSAANGWSELITAIRQILAGNRDANLLGGLDEEDSVIVDAILRGIQDPDTLAATTAPADPLFAAPGLAAMIDAASKGDVNALTLVSNMAEQMVKVDGEMAKIGALVRRLVNGEREADKLCKGLGKTGEQLVLNILAELGKINAH